MTLGQVKVDLANCIPTVFHIVPNHFPLNLDGILGSPFFNNKVELSVEKQQIVYKNITLPLLNSQRNAEEIKQGKRRAAPVKPKAHNQALKDKNEILITEKRDSAEGKLTRYEQAQVSSVNIGSNTPTARIKLNAPQLNRECELLIDTGSEINLVKPSCVKSSAEINKDEQILIHGFGDAYELSSGTLAIDVCNVPTKFHLVPNGIPQNIDGLLGAPFFREGAVIDFKSEQIAKDNERVQLLQLAEFTESHVFQCHVEIDRTIFYCGMHSHVSLVANGRQQYLLSTTREVCQSLHATGTLYVTPTAQLTGIQGNSTTSRSLTLAGEIKHDGRCSGTTYSDPFDTWTSVVVQAVVRVTIKDYTAPVKFSTGLIRLQSGQTCPLDKGTCLDTQDGYTFWDTVPTDDCKFNNYDVLYEGFATKISSKVEPTMTLYTVSSQDAMFALTEAGKSNICGYTIIRTEHPKLFILETSWAGTFKTKTRTSVNNLDIFTYVNSKFVYVEKHLRNQLSKLYRDVIRQKCELEIQIMQNALTQLHIAPEEVATAIMKEPGFIAVPAGEVVHIIKCVPVTVQFLKPKDHIISSTGTQKPCNELIPPLYKLHGVWYRLTPSLVETVAPSLLQPLATPAWKYVDPKNLATGGIYSQDDLENLQEHIMFPVDKVAVINSIAQGASGRQYASDSINMFNLLDEHSLQQIAESTAQKLWSGLTTFGSVSAALIGIYIIFKMIKIIINTIMNGMALHSIYGWSMHLAAAIWGSLTRFFIFLKRRDEAYSYAVRYTRTETSDKNKVESVEENPTPLPEPEEKKPEPESQTQTKPTPNPRDQADYVYMHPIYRKVNPDTLLPK
ncbi:uncharacterized protein LOC143364870 [Halictus rubicundus]|uniref:uncharacterized protein LOC143364870 n=1 Tax=Halictus rubicundus TaxID=77578 RepID=UPI0040356C7C